jgi:hypothetical protein
MQSLLCSQGVFKLYSTYGQNQNGFKKDYICHKIHDILQIATTRRLRWWNMRQISVAIL